MNMPHLPNSHYQMLTPSPGDSGPAGTRSVQNPIREGSSPSPSACRVPVPGAFARRGTGLGQPGPLSHLPTLPAGCAMLSPAPWQVHTWGWPCLQPPWPDPPAHSQGLVSPDAQAPVAPGRDSITDTQAGRAAEAALPGDRLPGF